VETRLLVCYLTTGPLCYHGTMDKCQAGRRGYEKTRDALDEFRHREHLRAVEEWETTDKRCPHCEKPIPFEKRRNTFCSRSCRTAHTNAKRPKKNICEVCGQPTADKRQRCCSRACFEEVRYAENIQRWLNGEIPGGDWRGVSNYVRRWLIEQRGEQCWKCGWSETNPHTGKIPLQVHHKGDPTIHHPKTLELLCPNCHSLTESFGGANRGNGRKERYSAPG
jgi:hypothetical protein